LVLKLVKAFYVACTDAETFFSITPDQEECKRIGNSNEQVFKNCCSLIEFFHTNLPFIVAWFANTAANVFQEVQMGHIPVSWLNASCSKTLPNVVVPQIQIS
jgi:hypothetical protein